MKIPEQTLTIGKLAKSAGVGVETVRYYQRRGLLDTPARSGGGPSEATEATGPGGGPVRSP